MRAVERERQHLSSSTLEVPLVVGPRVWTLTFLSVGHATRTRAWREWASRFRPSLGLASEQVL